VGSRASSLDQNVRPRRTFVRSGIWVRLLFHWQRRLDLAPHQAGCAGTTSQVGLSRVGL